MKLAIVGSRTFTDFERLEEFVKDNSTSPVMLKESSELVDFCFLESTYYSQ